MSKRLFVGRVMELEALSAELTKVANGQGRLVFLGGEAGGGKTNLLQKFMSMVEAEESMPKARFISGACYHDTGHQSAMQPIIELIGELTEGTESNKPGFFSRLVKQTAPDWVAAIPVVGPVLGASMKTYRVAHEWQLGASEVDNPVNKLAKRFITIVKDTGADLPLVIIIEDAHWIDASSCAVLSRLERVLQELNVLLIITYRPERLESIHHFKQLMLEVMTKDNARNITLGSLNESDIHTYVQQRYGCPLHEHFAAWLLALSKGHPMFVTQFLNLLEQDGIIRMEGDSFALDGGLKLRNERWIVSGKLTDAVIPPSVDALLNQRIDRMLDDEQEILQLGSVQGDKFLSAVLAKILERNERGILSVLRNISKRYGIISIYEPDEWYRGKSEAYAFENTLLQRAFYDRLTPRERQLYHRDIAAILEAAIKDVGIETLSRKVILDLAFHHELAGNSAQAASYYVMASKSSFRDGGLSEAAELAESAITMLDEQYAFDEKSSGIFVDAAILFVTCRSKTADLEQRKRLYEIALKATEVAQTQGDNASTADLLSLCGYLEIQLGQAQLAIATMQSALDTAKRTGDQLSVCLAMVRLGSELAKRDLDTSLDLRQAAYELYIREVKPDSGTPRLEEERYFAKMRVSLGVGLFDAGRYSEAHAHLSFGVGRLRELRMLADLSEALNYLAQLETAWGDHEAAITLLEEALDLEIREIAGPWHGYNLALKGKILLDTGAVAPAEEALLSGHELAMQYEQADLLSIVRNYYAELLTCSSSRLYDPDKALRILETNIQDCLGWGMERSAVVAYHLIAKHLLNAGDVTNAVAMSCNAVQLLEDMGVLPAVKLEEIYYHHAVALRSAGNSDQSSLWLERAREVVEQKVRNIDHDEQRKRFLEEIPLNQQILQG